MNLFQNWKNFKICFWETNVSIAQDAGDATHAKLVGLKKEL